MSRLSKLIFVAAALSLGMSACYGQATRTWVSGVGDDVNPCSRTAPCKTFAGAISKTAAGGEIDVIDPGSFGALTINKALTVDGGSSFAGILGAGTNGIIVIAGASDIVTLRNLSIDGASTGVNGIRFLSGKALHLQNIEVFRFNQGIDFESPGSTLFIRDSRITGNIGNGVFMTLPGGGGAYRLSMHNTKVDGNGTGVLARDNARFTAQDSSFSGNGIGVSIQATLGIGQSEANLEHCNISNNSGNGITAGGPGAITSTVRISNNEITNNIGVGAQVSTNGLIFTFSNNRIVGNGTDGCAGCIAVGQN